MTNIEAEPEVQNTSFSMRALATKQAGCGDLKLDVAALDVPLIASPPHRAVRLCLAVAGFELTGATPPIPASEPQQQIVLDFLRRIPIRELVERHGV